MTARVVLPGISADNAEVDTDEEAAEEERGDGGAGDDLFEHLPDETEARGRIYVSTGSNLTGFPLARIWKYCTPEFGLWTIFVCHDFRII